jgi:hypothetical protein
VIYYAIVDVANGGRLCVEMAGRVGARTFVPVETRLLRNGLWRLLESRLGLSEAAVLLRSRSRRGAEGGFDRASVVATAAMVLSTPRYPWRTFSGTFGQSLVSGLLSMRR